MSDWMSTRPNHILGLAGLIEGLHKGQWSSSKAVITQLVIQLYEGERHIQPAVLEAGELVFINHPPHCLNIFSFKTIIK